MVLVLKNCTQQLCLFMWDSDTQLQMGRGVKGGGGGGGGGRGGV